MSALTSWVNDRKTATCYHSLDKDGSDDQLLRFKEMHRSRRRGAVTQVLPEDARFIKDMLQWIIMWKHINIYHSMDLDDGVEEEVSKNVPIAYLKFFREECKDSTLLSDEELVTKFSLVGQAVDS